MGKAKRTERGTHRCVTLVNEALVEFNTALDTDLHMNFATRECTMMMKIATRKINSKVKKPARTLACTYCPICGERLIEKQSEKQEEADA